MDIQTIRSLQAYIEEFFDPGDTIVLYFEVSDAVAENTVALLPKILASGNLVASVEYGTTIDWPHVLVVRFKRPSLRDKVLTTPLHELILKAFRVTGIDNISTIRIEGAQKSWPLQQPFLH